MANRGCFWPSLFKGFMIALVDLIFTGLEKAEGSASSLGLNCRSTVGSGSPGINLSLSLSFYNIQAENAQIGIQNAPQIDMSFLAAVLLGL